MVKAIFNSLFHKKYYDKFNVLPEQVKTELNFTKKSLNKEFTSLEIWHVRPKGYGDFNFIHCTYHTQNRLLEGLNQNKDKSRAIHKTENSLK